MAIEKQQLKNIDVSKLIPYINNSRTHSEHQVAQIAASIREFGFVAPIIVDTDMNVVAGHGRLMAAQVLELEKVPAIMVSGLTEAQRRAYVIADNKLAQNAGWDMQLLANEMQSLLEMDFDIGVIGFDDGFTQNLLEDVDLSILDDDDLDAAAAGKEKNVMRGIQIEFNPEDYEEAQELIKKVRDADGYVGGILIDCLRREFTE